MPHLRIALYVFGAIMLLIAANLGRQLWTEHLSSRIRVKSLHGSIEGWFLLAAALVVAIRYLIALIGAKAMPGIGSGWLAMYGISCGGYLAAKTTRAIRIHK